MKIAICFGTRPEVIKLCLLAYELAKAHDVVNIFTGQHHSLYDDVKHLMPEVHRSLRISEYRHMSFLYGELMGQLQLAFESVKPDLVIVQGDTASAYAASFCAFLNGIKVGHVEAGLRSGCINEPFPEEFNRQMIDRISDYSWCPSEDAAWNLEQENVGGLLYVTGNTVVDLMRRMIEVRKRTMDDVIAVTLHRRENQGEFSFLLEQLDEVALAHPDIRFVFPVHPNPIIRDKVNFLRASNIDITDPMRYDDFVDLLCQCRGIITDSGGLQEEAVCLKKKVLVCRTSTERPEALGVGISRVVGNRIVGNFEWLLDDLEDTEFANPYGNGDACLNIAKTLEGYGHV